MSAPAARLCAFHSRGVREDDEHNVRPPQGSALCSVCRRETEELVAARDTGTSTRVVISSHATEEQYLQGVSSPVARQMLEERRAQEHLDSEAKAQALAEMDFVRPFIEDIDKSKLGTERRQAVRRYRKAVGPRWP